MIEFLLYIRVLDLVTTHYKVVKIGVTDCKIERESTYKTGEYIPGYFSHLYKINYNGKREHFDKKLKKLTKKYNRIGYNEFDVEGGKEFYDIELIEKLEEYLKKITKYKLLDQDEIDEINRRSRSNVESDNDTENDTKSESESESESEETREYIWNEKEYQTTIIEYCKESLKINNKIYIELPTGGGKSYIVYNLFNHLKSNFILIV